MKNSLRLLTLVLSLTVCIAASGQMARLYTSEDGLPSSQINDIYQDGKGFIWISTENGLALFDGTEMHCLQSSRDWSGSLASNLVLTTMEDRSGVFWTGTSKGLQTYDYETGDFTIVDLCDMAVPLSTQHISSIVEVSTGGEDFEIWVGTSQHGIYILDGKTHKPDPQRQSAVNALLPSLFVSRIFPDSAGRMWIASETGGLAVIDRSTLKDLSAGMCQGETLQLAPELLVTGFAEDSKSGDIIVGTSNRGLLVYSSATGRLRRSSDRKARECSAMSLLPDRVFSRAGDRAFIVGTEGQGFKIYDLGTDSLREAGSGNILINTSGWKIHSLLEDNQGNVWMGAFLTGVMVVPRSMYGFEYLHIDGCVTSILKDGGSLWVGTDGDGLVRIDPDGRRTVYNSSNSGLGSDTVMALAKDAGGALWIATYQGGLFKYAGGVIRPFADNAGIGSSKTVALAYDSSRDLLFVGTHGAGMSIISTWSGKVTHRISDDLSKWVSALYLDRGGMLWVGTFNGPLCYSHTTGRLIRYDIGDLSQNARVYCFCEGRDSKMWIGTGEGLLGYDMAGGKGVRYTEEDGLSSNVVCGILESEDGNIWLSTFRGLSRLNPSSGKFSRYYSYDGLQENEFHYRAAFKCNDGQMIFGGINGLNLFYPQVIDQKHHDIPPIYFTALKVRGKNVYHGTEGDREILDRHITEATSVTLPYADNSFSLEYAVLEYSNPQKMIYAHKLERFDRDWIYSSPAQRAASYTNLPAGRYTLKVKAYFENREDAFSERSISIRVLPPWYRSTGAYLGYFLLLCGAGLLAARAVCKEKRHEQERQEADIKDMKLEMFTSISHEIRTPMTLVMSPLKELREAETDPRRKDLYNLMYRNCHRVLRLVNQLMDVRKLDSGKMEFHFRETDIVFFIRDIVQSFQNLAQKRNISLQLRSADPEEKMWIDQGNFDKVIFNLLSNAFKYTPDGGRVELSISAPLPNDGKLAAGIAKYLRIDIFNSGGSISDPDRVFDQFFTEEKSGSHTGYGLGLYLAKTLVERHHGTIEVHNSDEGVSFSVCIPCGRGHLSDEEMTPTELHKDLYTRYSREQEIGSGQAGGDSDRELRDSKSKKTIVVADGDSEIRSYLRMELSRTYNVKSCASGKAAWGIISTTVPDAVIADLSMEGMDGLELCSHIKHNPGTNHIPVIIISTHTDEETEQMCSESGADKFLTKPLSMDLLKSALVNSIATRETLRSKFTSGIQYDYGEMKMNVRGGSQLLDNAIEVIKRNLDNPDFSVESLSKEVGMSRVHLNRRLKEAMNISPSNLIRSMRLKQAAWLLIHNEANVSEVSYRIGFSSPSYFSSSFHEYFGMSPKEFLAKYRGCEDADTLNKIFGENYEHIEGK
jgi:signal transduction histidine kinase/ligand-binding sensor domain-containing protein/AraC-like DNA-binding protein